LTIYWREYNTNSLADEIGIQQWSRYKLVGLLIRSHLGRRHSMICLDEKNNEKNISWIALLQSHASIEPVYFSGHLATRISHHWVYWWLLYSLYL